MTMFVVPRDRPHSRLKFRPHRREGGEQHVRESRSEPDNLDSVSLLVHGAAPELVGLGLGLRWGLGCLSIENNFGLGLGLGLGLKTSALKHEQAVLIH